MASTSEGKKAATRGLNALEISIHKNALSYPKQIAQQEDMDAIDAPHDAKVAAINFLLRAGYMKLMRFERTNKLAYKAVQVQETQNMDLLGDDVQTNLARIEEAGNEGCKTELPRTVVNKCIETLESQGIIAIIGAGPSGLVAALTLLQEGHRVAIYDALPKGQNGSRAAAVHAHTLEQLHTLGYAEQLISKGIKGQGVINYDCTTPIMQLSLTEYLEGLTEYPFALLIPQHEVERILEEKLNELGVKVRREMRIKGVEASDSKGIELTFENGETTQVTYLIGADGSRSMVRELAGISFTNPFNGEPYHIPHREATGEGLQYLVLADVVLEGSYPSTFLRDHLSTTIDPVGMFLIIPLPLPDDIHQRDAESLSFWRAVFNITVKNEPPPAKPDLAYVQEYFSKHQGIWEEKYWPKVLEVRESSRYRVREAVASTMHKPLGPRGHVLLIGDAAHVHSPAGGQGMNLGICDAVALGRTLSKHVKGGSQDNHLLEEYSRKRLIVAKDVIKLATTGLNTVNYLIAMPALVRRLVTGVVNFMGFAKRRLVLQVSGLMNRAYD